MSHANFLRKRYRDFSGNTPQMKTVLTAIILVLSLSASAQSVLAFRADTVSIRTRTGPDTFAENWQRIPMQPGAKVLVMLDTLKNVINIYSKEEQKLHIIGASYSYPGNGAMTIAKFTCVNSKNIKLYAFFSFYKRSPEKATTELSLVSSDLMVKYNLVPAL